LGPGGSVVRLNCWVKNRWKNTPQPAFERRGVVAFREREPASAKIFSGPAP